jgi:ActR/RegA family two-component response regulator
MKNRVLRLLIVDDLEKWRQSLRSQFSHRTDISVTESAGPSDALKRVTTDDFDLVLLDMKMPTDTEGLHVLREMKKVKPQTQVIMMSAYGDIPKAVYAIRSGALDFVQKESDFDEVIAFKVDEYIRTSSLIADRELLIQTLYEQAEASADPLLRGKALERLLAALLASIEGFMEIGHNLRTETEEIDLVFRNASRDPFWQKQSEIILVECKNWQAHRVGKNEFVAFREKMANRHGRCKLGFLVCTGRFTSTFGRERLRSSKTDYLIVPIDGGVLRKLVGSDQRDRLLRRSVERALLS